MNVKNIIAKHDAPLIMGILNTTPDSFYDGGRYNTADQALEHATAMIAAGADIIDVGGESTRPGASIIDEQSELERVIPAIKAIRSSSNVLISVDTTKAVVAEQAIDAGADIINDISALRADPAMSMLAASRQVPVIIMHMQGTPQTMQQNPSYNDWVVDEICDFLSERASVLERQGIHRDNMIIDPGIGFGKTCEHNLDIIAACQYIRKKCGLPVLVGPSQKRFIGETLGITPDERIWGTAAVVAWLAAQQTDIIRIHNVAEMKYVAAMIGAIANRKRVCAHAT